MNFQKMNLRAVRIEQQELGQQERLLQQQEVRKMNFVKHSKPEHVEQPFQLED